MARKKFKRGEFVVTVSDFKILSNVRMVRMDRRYATIEKSKASSGKVLGYYGVGNVMVEFTWPLIHGHAGWDELAGEKGHCLLVPENVLERDVTYYEAQRIIKLIRAGKFPEYSTDIRIVDIDGLLQLIRIDFIPIFSHDCIIEELETI